MRRGAAALLALSPAVGCAAGSLSAADPEAAFGRLGDAARVRDARNGTELLVATPATGACEGLRELAAAQAALDAALAAGAGCAETEALARAWADAGAALYAPGAAWLTVRVSTGGDDALAPGAYTVGEDPSVEGRLVRYANAPHGGVAEAWEADGAPPECGLDEDDLAVEATAWTLAAGALTLAGAAPAGAVEARFEGRLADAAGADAGEVSFVVRAQDCPVPAE